MTPVYIGLENVNSFEGMQHVVETQAREEHVVDVSDVGVGDWQLQDSKAALYFAEDELDILLRCFTPRFLLGSRQRGLCWWL